MNFSDELQQWLTVEKQADVCLDIADAAYQAHFEHFHDRVKGIERIVDKHLKRIAQREFSACELLHVIAESPALELGDEEQ